jgi:hypothetical protein
VFGQRGVAQESRRPCRTSVIVLGRGDAGSPSTWIVHWDHRAVEEFNSYSDKRTRRSVLTVVDILHKIGPKLVAPHAKSLTGEKKLRELRPGGGRVLVRPLYVRLNDREFVILAVGPESVVDASGFKRAVERAKARAKSDWGMDV